MTNTAHQDSVGTAHTDYCWANAHAVLNEEVMAQTLPAAAEYLELTDRVAIWDGALVSSVVADWLSDGTTDCRCADSPAYQLAN